MGRTESISFQVHPDDEQSQINIMQQFHWSLLSTQEIKVIDNHMEQRGDKIYSVTKTEHYVKLAFSRELDLPNLKEVKQLESEYNSLPRPEYPKMFPVSVWLWVVLALVYGLGILGWLIYYITSYKPKQSKAEDVHANLLKNRERILKEVQKYS